MAISSSLATKAGVAGVITAGGSGLVGTYYAWDHITLYAVEREVIGKDLKFTISDPNTSEKTITIEATKHGAASANDKATLPQNYSWECKIDVKGDTVTDDEVKDLASQLKNVLPTTDAQFKSWTKQHRDSVRSILVRACSKQRDDKTEASKDSKVKGQLTLSKEGSAFLFKGYKELQEVLNSSLSKVEREVIEKDMKLTVNSANKKITITAPTSGSEPILTSGTTWTCEINVEPEPASIDSSLTTNLQNSLYKNSAIDANNKINKELLVRACSPKTRPTGNTVTGELILTKEGNDYKFKEHSELDELTKTVTPGA